MSCIAFPGKSFENASLNRTIGSPNSDRFMGDCALLLQTQSFLRNILLLASDLSDQRMNHILETPFRWLVGDIPSDLFLEGVHERPTPSIRLNLFESSR